MALHEFRASSTATVVALLTNAFRHFETDGEFKGAKQRRKGRYYSSMPAIMKDLCVRNFAKYTASLTEQEDER